MRRGGIWMARKEGSLGGEMRIRINEHCKTKSNKTRRNYLKACACFDKWRKSVGLSNSVVRKDRKGAVEKWRDALIADGYAASTIHTYIFETRLRLSTICSENFKLNFLSYYGCNRPLENHISDGRLSHLLF